MKQTKEDKKKLVLAILDGWGLASPGPGNAITLARKPNIDRWWKLYPHTQLCASGNCVGLEMGQDGNSEAGHMNLGAGRVVIQDNLIVSAAIEDGTFFKNLALLALIKHLKQNGSKLHLMGLLTNSSSAHANPKHLNALLNFFRQQGIEKIYLHLFTDGRDSPQHSAIQYVNKLRKKLLPHEQIATITGRFYAMDRKKQWERTEKTYDALVLGLGHHELSAEDAICHAYNRQETDEYISPTVITKKNQLLGLIDNNDGIFFFNLRSDRARQITKPFSQKNFLGWQRKKVLKNLCFVALTDFGPDLGNILTAFPSKDLKGTLPMALQDWHQLYISEEEKYAHVTYFFNGGYKDPVAGEDREMIPSPKVTFYDQYPEMSTKELTDKIITYLEAEKYDFITCNYPAPDMIGHTGNIKAAIKAIETIDQNIVRLWSVVKKVKGVLIVTADHGNAEEMLNLKTGEVDTDHSSNPVPFIILGAGKIKLKKSGALSNVAPTILKLLGLAKPKEMTGKALF